jgi:hypothetical protein
VTNRFRECLLVCVAVFGCGRIGFDQLSSDAGDSDAPVNAACQSFSGGSFGGTGTAQDPFVICSAEQFASIGQQSMLWNSHFLLGADLDLVSFDGTSLAKTISAIGTTTKAFTGSFDGGNHSISNATIVVSTDGGMFGLTEGATISNLRLIKQITIAAVPAVNIGLLAGRMLNSSVSQVTASGQLRGRDASATFTSTGFIGVFNASGMATYIDDVSAVLTTSEACDAAAGLVGNLAVSNGGKVDIQRTRVQVDLGTCPQSNNTFGAFIGIAVVSKAGILNINDSLAKGNISFPRFGSFSGNFIGTVEVNNPGSVTTLQRVASLADLIVAGDYPVAPGESGGLVGHLNANDGAAISITQSYNTGSLEVTNSNGAAHSGGLVGSAGVNGSGSSFKVADCYALSNVKSAGLHTGVSAGFGYLSVAGTGSVVFERIFISGSTSGPNLALAGGFLGDGRTATNVSGSELFYDQTIDAHPAVGGGPSIAAIVGKTTTQMTSAATFATWDPAVWNMVDGQLPTLKGLPIP